MMRLKFLVTAAILSGVLAGCSQHNMPEPPPQELYASAQQELQNGNFKSAIKQLEALDNRYSFGSYAQQVQLQLIYAYYKNDNQSLALAMISRFIRLNPTHSNIDYVLYIKGLIDMEQDESGLQRLFGIDRSDREPQYAHDAFRDFSQLLRDYPQSQYANDAHQRLIYLKNRLAKYELAVAKFYTQRGAYVAVVNRIEQMMSDYPDTQATRTALPLMENAYCQLQLKAEAEKVAKIIANNPI